MSFSKSKIIKHTVQQEEAIHIGEHIASPQEQYIEMTSKKRLQDYQKEIDEYRHLEMKKVLESVEKIREDAYKEGLSQAKEEALNEARAEMENKVRQEWEEQFEVIKLQYDSVNQYMMDQEYKIKDKKNQWFLENESEIKEILIASVEKILSKEKTLDDNELINLVKESLNEVNDKSKTIWVRVHPDVMKKIESQQWNDRKIEWIADPQLSQIDVLIETETEWIDSTVKNKIENLKKIIEEWVNKNDLLNES